MKNASAVNTFEGGIVSDLNPVTTPNNTLINCLNGTLVTYNGNEGVLQNDMGNGRVHTAYLPEGYIPLGTAELGGIIYIVSYNPLIKKCQIGSFPSPQRNIAVNNLINDNKKVLNCKEFYRKDANDIPTPYVITNNIKVILTNDNLNPGDKFCINCEDINNILDENEEKKEAKPPILSAYGSPEYDINALPRQLKLHVVSVQDDGKIIYLDDNLVWYNIKEDKYYYINNQDIKETPDITEFRNLIEGNYNIFNTKQSGKLAILAELEAINTFDVEIIPSEITDLGNGEKQVIIGFNFNWTYENPNPESRPLINPEGIHILPNSPESLKLSKDIIDIPFTEDNSDFSERKNDGSDPSVKIEQWKSFTYNLNESNFLDLDLMPTMKYGHLEYLKRNIQIDLNKLGTGTTELIQYKYFAQNTLFNFSYGIASYPEYGKQVNGCKIEFYPFNQNIYNNIKLYENRMDNDYMTASYHKDGDEICLTSNGWKNNPKQDEDNKLLTDFIDKQTNKVEYTIENNSNSLFGYYEEIINYDEEEKSGLCKDKCYLAKIIINYNNEEARIYYRILYTCDIFNTEYYNNEIKDFKDLSLSKYLNTRLSIRTSNTLIDSDRKYSDTIVNILDESSSKEYIIKDKYEYNTELDISRVSSNPDLFKFNISTNNIDLTFREPKGSSNATQQYIQLLKDLSPIKVETIPKCVNIISLQNSIVININNNITNEIPILADYLNFISIPYKYKIVPLSGELRYLNVGMGGKTSNISYSSNFEDPGIRTLGTPDWIDVDHFTELGDIQSRIDTDISNCDFIALCFCVYHNKDGHDAYITLQPLGRIALNIPNGGEFEGDPRGCCILLAVRNVNGGYNLLWREWTIYSLDRNKKEFPYKPGYTSMAESYGFDTNSVKALDEFYKFIPTKENKKAYNCNNINYWSNFDSKVTIVTDPIEIKSELYIQGVYIHKSKDTDTHINNLDYINKVDRENLEFTINTRIILDNIIQEILSNNYGEYAYLEDDQNKIISYNVQNLSNRSVYILNNGELKDVRNTVPNAFSIWLDVAINEDSKLVVTRLPQNRSYYFLFDRDKKDIRINHIYEMSKKKWV